MKRFALCTLLALATASHAFGQGRTVVSGTVTDAQGLAYIGAQMTVTLTLPVGVSGAILNGVQVQGVVGPLQLDPTGSFLIQLPDNTVLQCTNAQGQIIACAPQTQWTFAITFSPGLAPPLGTGPQTCSATLTISGSLQSVSSALGACPSLSKAGRGSACTGANACIDPTQAPYSIPANAKYVVDATWSSGSNPTTVTCPNGDCSFTPADTGKSCFGVAGAAYLAAAKGTFTFVSAQSGTCSGGTGVGNPVATGRFIWYNSDTTGLVSATTALYALPHCGTLQLPAGVMVLGQGIGSSIPAACSTAGDSGSGIAVGINIFGRGRTTTIIVPEEGFNFSTCGGSGCFWQGTLGLTSGGHDYRDFSIDGLGANLSGISSSPASFLFTVDVAGSAQNLSLVNWGSLLTNNPGGLQLDNQGSYVLNIQEEGWASGNALVNNGPNAAAMNGFFFPTGSITGVVAANIFYTFNVTLGAGGAGCMAGVSSTWYSSFDSMQSPSAFGFCMSPGGKLILNGLTATPSPPAAFQQINIVSGSTVSLQNTALIGGSTGGSIGGSAGTLINAGGNSSNAAPFSFGGTYIDLTGTFPGGTCTGTATSSATLGLYGTGPNETLTTCTSATIGNGVAMPKAGTIFELLATATHAGVNASSGAVTVLKNGVAQSMTCTIGTGTSCQDGVVAHQISVAKGDLISLQFTTQAAEVLAGVQANLIIF